MLTTLHRISSYLLIALGDMQYSDLLVVTVPPTGIARLIKAQYGAAAVGNNVMK
jgi:hypothetical protein